MAEEWMNDPEARTVAAVRRVLVRDLKALAEELRAYPSDEAVWSTAGAISNSAGTLALHLCGNLRHFIGATLGGTGYVRDRDAEFSRRDVPRGDLLAEIDAAIREVEGTLARLKDADLASEYPLPLNGEPIGATHFMVHLAAPFAYHLGQVNYHRRLIG